MFVERVTWGRPILTLLLLALTSSCADETADGNLVVSFEPGALTGPAADPGTPMTDEIGYARLDWFPAFLLATVEAGDLEAPVIGTWPSLIPESVPEEVVLEIDVPAGSGRHLTVEVLIADESGDTSTYVDPPPTGASQEFDIVSGRETDVVVELVELPYGTVIATVTPSDGAESIAWVDDDAGAILPPRALIDGSVESQLAVGRTYWPRIIDQDGHFIDLTSRLVDWSEWDEEQPLEIALEIDP